MKKIMTVLIILALLAACGCGEDEPAADASAQAGQAGETEPAATQAEQPADSSAQSTDASAHSPATYKQISQDEAKRMMELDDGHVVVDVRRPDEYAQGHIPGAILIPNEHIINTPPSQLPDPEQIILIYCRTGRRSKEASQKLADMGYTNVYEFGGIYDWTGEVVMDEPSEEPAPSATHSDPAGGASQHEESAASAAYSDPAGGASQPEDPAPSAAYSDPAGASQPEEPAMPASSDPAPEDRKMTLMINGEQFSVKWEDNESVEALGELCPLTVEMSMYGGFEQVGPLGTSLPRSDSQTTTSAGDICLYSGNQIVIFYGSNSWAYTRLGHIDADAGRLAAVLGNGNVTIEIGK